MSPLSALDESAVRRPPRASGDEPDSKLKSDMGVSSAPRERG